MTKTKLPETLDKGFVEQYKNRVVPWGFNGLGYIVYKRTYAREIAHLGRTEEWYETIERCINGAQKIGAGYTQKEMERLFDLMFNLKCSFAGRMLWQLGTETVDKIGLASLLNCWFTTIRTPEDFCFIFNHLMLGGGVGFSVKREDIHELPRVKTGVKVSHEKTTDADFILPDSREGWVELLRRTLNAYFVTGEGFTYSTILIREKGAPIKTFGGKASGPHILVEGIEKICSVLSSREGKKLRSVDALDIANIIGSIVVAGNVRRSAELAFGDPDDFLFIRAKRWDIGSIPSWRAMSNNSIAVDDYDQISDDVWSGFEGNGEAYGLVNLKLSRKYGRLGEKIRDDVEGFNPCVEATLSDKEPCDLAEIFINNITSKDEMAECGVLLYKTLKAVLTLPALYNETEKVIRKNMRIGIGVTGICQSLGVFEEWSDYTYRTVKDFDAKWSEERGWNKSIKLSVIKPSGTLSLLSGSTPGIHPGYSRHFLRRVKMAADDPLVDVCIQAGFSREYQLNFDGTYDHNTVIIGFPCKFSDDTIIAHDVSAVQQLEMVKTAQTVWADQAVSNTVYYRKEELPEIREWLKKNYSTSVKSTSFLLHSDHGFKQAPYEEITKEHYESMIKNVKPVVIGDVSGSLLDIECEGGACPIR